MRSAYLILALVALTSAQNPRPLKKHGQGKQQQYIAASPGPNHGGGGGGGSYQNQGYSGQQLGGATAKQAYPLLLSDSRTLNTDGSINFNYAADNGLQQGETVDADGTRRGFYSYPGADGKPITVKYTAGKNGFVAEGDHLPRQPQSALHSDKDDGDYVPYVPKSQRGGGGGGGGGHYSNPPVYNLGGGGRPAVRQVDYNVPSSVPAGVSAGSHYNAPQNRPSVVNYGQAGPGTSFSSLHGAGPSGPSGPSGGGNPFAGFASGNPAYAGQTQYNNYAGAGAPRAPQAYTPPAAAFTGAGGRGQMNSVLNPYIQQGPAGPYNGNFDLGNGGHFSINFAPGQGQEYNPNQGFGGQGGRQQQY